MRTFYALSLTVALLSGCSARPDDVAAFSDDPLSVHQGYMVPLGVPQAWKHERGSVVVAVVDNGVDVAHPDLAARIWTNPNEIPNNGMDDDNNGLVDDIHGWNFVDGNADISPAPAENAEHGTAVAGIIAAETDNGLGVAGCCPGCEIMVLKARDFKTVSSALPRLGEVIDYAIAKGAKVINISDGLLSSMTSEEVLQEAEQAATRADAAGVLIVASAGNDAAHAVRWPARVDSTLAVAAVDWQGVPTQWTSFGEEVDVAAPGVYVFTTNPGNAYGDFSGTSASAPIAAGLAALLLSAHPDWSPAEVVARIKKTATPAVLDNRPELEGLFGAGVVNFSAALADR